MLRSIGMVSRPHFSQKRCLLGNSFSGQEGAERRINMSWIDPAAESQDLMPKCKAHGGVLHMLVGSSHLHQSHLV